MGYLPRDSPILLKRREEFEQGRVEVIRKNPEYERELCEQLN
jgi:hypothetical protein